MPCPSWERCVRKCGEVGDEGGHLIASSLGRAGDRINLVSQASALNRIGWRKMEK
ncbi:DNA/RNA non-specific endonuclease [Xylella fastidiosa]|uniref:DNA/RNA non-specific endonuclease n=1 Tax=Xylella fastidiosa TaxID=2371 RepID=UPI003CE51627